MWFCYLLLIIVALVIDYFIAKKFEEIAEMKGHIGSTYFWFTFLFGVAGMLMVVALPIQTAAEDHKAVLPPAKDIWAKAQANAADLQSTKRCPYCGGIVKMGRCETCEKEVK